MLPYKILGWNFQNLINILSHTNVYSLSDDGHRTHNLKTESLKNHDK